MATELRHRKVRNADEVKFDLWFSIRVWGIGLLLAIASGIGTYYHLPDWHILFKIGLSFLVFIVAIVLYALGVIGFAMSTSINEVDH